LGIVHTPLSIDGAGWAFKGVKTKKCGRSGGRIEIQPCQTVKSDSQPSGSFSKPTVSRNEFSACELWKKAA